MFNENRASRGPPCSGKDKIGYFALGVSVAAGLASLFTPSSFLSLASGVAVPIGEPVGLAAGAAVAVGAGVASLAGVSGFGSQAPNAAVETARTDINTNDLLIFSP